MNPRPVALRLIRVGLPGLVRIAVGVALLVAATMKLTTFQIIPEQGPATGIAVFVAQLRIHGLVPDALALPTALAVIIAEIAIGAWLLTHRAPRRATIAATILMLAFTAYLGVARLTGVTSNCGCFGAMSETGIDAALLRNAGMLAALTIAGVLETGRNRPTLRDPSPAPSPGPSPRGSRQQ